MLRWALGFSLQYRFLALACAAALIFFGAYRLPDTPVDVLPEFSAPIIQIQTEALGLSTAEVEDLVTLNLEEILTSVAWLKTIRSKSMTGLSSILLVFDPGTDLMRARQLVQERLNLAHAMPNVSKPPVMLQPLSTTSRAMMVGLSSKDVSLIDASVLARWTIMPKLQGVPGVANVSAWGLRSRQLQVQVDQKRMQDRRVSLSQVIKSTGEALWVSPLSFLEASTPGAGGWIDTPNQRLGIQHVQPITTPGDLAKVSIADTLVNLGDVAKVVEGHPPLIGDAVIDNGPGLLLVIEKFPHVSALGVVRGVDAALNELRQGLPGIEIDASIFRSTNFVDLSFANLGMALLIGGGLLILVLSAGFFTWRAALISIVAIVLSLLAAGLVAYLRGVTINMMVVAGFAVALAAVIDDAIIDTDNILRRLRRHMSQRSDSSTATAIFEACLETRSPIAYAVLILVLAVTPLFLISGPLGAFLSPFAISFVVALLASMAVAITVTPALAMVLLRDAALNHLEPPLLRWLQPRYEAVLSRAVRAPRLPVLVAGAFMLAGLAVLPLLNWSLLPSFKERDVLISWKAASGTSLPEMRRIVTRAGEELRLVPGIRNVAAHIGRAVSGDQVVGIEAGQIWVSIDANAKYDATLAAIRETVQGYPGIDVEVQTYVAAKMKEILTSAVEPIVVRIQGPEREQLRREAEKVAKTLSGISGLNNLRLDGRVEAPHVEIEVNLAAAGRVGLKPGDVRRAAATFFAGLEVGNLFEQQKVFEVVVWGAAESRQSLTNIRELLVDTPNDGSVPLSDIAEVRLKATPIVYERSDVSPHIDIRADVAGRDVASIVKDVKERLQKIEFPLEYHPVLLKDYAERQAAHWPILIAALAAVVGIFLLLHAYFQSWRLASLVCLSLLAALLGGVLTLFAAGGTVFLGSLAGCLAVLGVAVRNGILLISRYQSLEREDGQAFGPELVLRGARERLGPIATSATAIGVAVLPVMVLGDIAGLEILHPMAVVILGGLMVSAIINLFVVPALYLSFARPQPEMQPYGSEQHA